MRLGRGPGTRREGRSTEPLISRTVWMPPRHPSQPARKPGTGSTPAPPSAPPQPRCPRPQSQRPRPAPPAHRAGRPALTVVLGPLVAAHDLFGLPSRGPGGRRRVDSNQHILEDAVGVDVHVGDLGEARRRHVPGARSPCGPRPCPARPRAARTARGAGPGGRWPIPRGHAVRAQRLSQPCGRPAAQTGQSRPSSLQRGDRTGSP